MEMLVVGLVVLLVAATYLLYRLVASLQPKS